jgi:hypothetical protein
MHRDCLNLIIRLLTFLLDIFNQFSINRQAINQASVTNIKIFFFQLTFFLEFNLITVSKKSQKFMFYE